jgi:hypothetical protein
MVIFLFSGTAYSLENWDSYFESISQETISRPTLRTQYASSPSIESKKGSRRVKPLEISTNSSSKLVEFRYENKAPLLVVEMQGRKYQTSFAPGSIQNFTALALLKNLGFELVKFVDVRRMKVSLGLQKALDFYRFWNESPTKLPFDRYFYDSPDQGNIVQIKSTLIEELGDKVVNLKELALNNKVLLISLMWLQCDQVTPNLDSLRYCLGNTPTESSPNFFDNQWLEKKTENTFMFRNFIYDEELRNLANSLTKNDFLNFYNQMMEIDFDDFKKTFRQLGYPDILNALYVAKLQSRLSHLGYVLGQEPKAVWRINQINDLNFSPYIKKGMLVKEFENFKIDFTQVNLTSLLEEKISSSFDKIESLAKYILATFPFTSFEVGKIGQTHFAPGFLFRIKREVIQNQNSLSKSDRYLIKDSVEFQLMFGIGVELENPVVNTYASVSPGFVKNVTYVRPAASLEEAKKTYWSIPRDVLIKSNFVNVLKNEILAVESGFSGNIIVGAGIYTGIPKTKPQGYLTTSRQYLSSFQITRKNDGKFLVIASHDIKNYFASKLFFRFFTKLVRVPFAASTQIEGKGEQEAYLIDPNSGADWNRQKQNSLQSALQNGDINALKNAFPSNQIKTDYSWSNWFLNLYFFERTSQSNRTSIEQVFDSNHNKYYDLVSNRNSMNYNVGALPINENCIFSGVAQLPEAKSKNADDAAITFVCEIVFREVSELTIKRKVDSIARMLNLSNSLKNELNLRMRGSPVDSRIVVSGDISNLDLLNLVNRDVNTRADIVNFMREQNLTEKTELLTLADLEKRRKNTYLVVSLFQVISKKGATDRLMSLTKLLSTPSVEDDFKLHFLPRMRSLNYKIETFNLNTMNLVEMVTPIEKQSEKSSSEAMHLLNSRTVGLDRNLFDAL